MGSAICIKVDVGCPGAFLSLSQLLLACSWVAQAAVESWMRRWTCLRP